MKLADCLILIGVNIQVLHRSNNGLQYVCFLFVVIDWNPLITVLWYSWLCTFHVFILINAAGKGIFWSNEHSVIVSSISCV